VIDQVGRMDPLQQGGAFSCIYVAGITNNGAAGTGAVEVLNNTVSIVGPITPRMPAAHAARLVWRRTGPLIMRLQNNIAYQLSGGYTLTAAKRKSQVTETFVRRWPSRRRPRTTSVTIRCLQTGVWVISLDQLQSSQGHGHDHCAK